MRDLQLQQPDFQIQSLSQWLVKDFQRSWKIDKVKYFKESLKNNIQQFSKSEINQEHIFSLLESSSAFNSYSLSETLYWANTIVLSNH